MMSRAGEGGSPRSVRGQSTQCGAGNWSRALLLQRTGMLCSSRSRPRHFSTLLRVVCRIDGKMFCFPIEGKAQEQDGQKLCSLVDGSKINNTESRQEQNPPRTRCKHNTLPLKRLNFAQVELHKSLKHQSRNCKTMESLHRSQVDLQRLHSEPSGITSVSNRS